jgi:hypothetical protein
MLLFHYPVHPFIQCILVQTIRNFAWPIHLSLPEKLYGKLKETDKPWFRHALYRLPGIDQILLNIESFGKQKEFETLQSLFDRLKEEKDFHAGVRTRMEWTIGRLKERAGKTLESKNEK